MATAVSGKVVHLKDGNKYFKADDPPTQAKLLLEESTGIIFIDMDECADDNSLACIVDDIQQRCQRGLDHKVIILTIQASAKHPALHRYLLRSGAFMVGLRSTNLPIIGVYAGRIAGPAWSLLLTCDYRIGVSNTIYHLPVCSAPRCIQTLVGPSMATELCLSTTTLDSNQCLDIGLLNESRPSFDEAKYAAYEMAKRLCGFPHIGVRQTLCLLCPNAKEYANAIAEEPSLMAQVYPDDSVMNQ